MMCNNVYNRCNHDGWVIPSPMTRVSLLYPAVIAEPELPNSVIEEVAEVCDAFSPSGPQPQSYVASSVRQSNSGLPNRSLTRLWT